MMNSLSQVLHVFLLQEDKIKLQHEKETGFLCFNVLHFSFM